MRRRHVHAPAGAALPGPGSSIARRARAHRSAGALACLVVATAALGCASSRVPDPRDAADAYAEAAARGDSDAIYDMMTTSAQKARTRAEVKELVSAERSELTEQARAVTDSSARAKATARLRFEDGEEAALDWNEGRFWVTSSGALPGGARTPEEALDQLRRVLARRSYAGLMRVVSPSTRAAIENDLRALVTGLEHPETLPVQVSGESATVAVPGGHHVHLKRDAGVWRIDDFD